MIFICLILIVVILYNLFHPCFCDQEGLEDYNNTFSTHIDIDNTVLSMKHTDHPDADPGMVAKLLDNNSTDSSFSEVEFHKLGNQVYYADNEIANDLKYFNNSSSLLHFHEDNSSNDRINYCDTVGISCDPINTDFLPVQNGDDDVSYSRMFSRLTQEDESVLTTMDNDISANKQEQAFFNAYLHDDGRFMGWYKVLQSLFLVISEQDITKMYQNYETNRFNSKFYLRENGIDSELRLKFDEYNKLNNAVMFVNMYINYVTDDLTYDINYSDLVATPSNDKYDASYGDSTGSELANGMFSAIEVNVNQELTDIVFDRDETLNEKFKQLMGATKEAVQSNLSTVKKKITKMKAMQLNTIRIGVQKTEERKYQTLYEPTGFYSMKYFVSNLEEPEVQDDFKWFNNSSAIFAGYLKYKKVS